MDGVNRDREMEIRFREFATGPKGAMGHVESLWNAFRLMRQSDLKKMRPDTFTLVKGIMYLSWMHFSVMDGEKDFYHYARWFMENRLVNTGSNGRAKCEMSELFNVPEKGRKELI